METHLPSSLHDIDRRVFASGLTARRLAGPALAAAGLVGGFALGCVARGFMRLLAEDPEFTWSGTLFIVGAFAVFGAVQAIVAVVRRASSRRSITTPARVLGGLSLAVLGMGAGMMMIFWLWCAPLACWRTDWRRTVRGVLAAVAVTNAVVVAALSVSAAGLSWSTMFGVATFLAVYCAIAATAGVTLRPPQ